MLFFFKNGIVPMMIRALPGFAYELLLIFPGGLCLLRASFAYASFVWIKSMKFCKLTAEFHGISARKAPKSMKFCNHAAEFHAFCLSGA